MCIYNYIYIYIYIERERETERERVRPASFSACSRVLIVAWCSGKPRAWRSLRVHGHRKLGSHTLSGIKTKVAISRTPHKISCVC